MVLHCLQVLCLLLGSVAFENFEVELVLRRLYLVVEGLAGCRQSGHFVMQLHQVLLSVILAANFTVKLLLQLIQLYFLLAQQRNLLMLRCLYQT